MSNTNVPGCFPEHAQVWFSPDVSPIYVPAVDPSLYDQDHSAASNVPLNGSSGLRASANGNVCYDFESVDLSELIPSLVLRVNAALDADFTLNGVEGVLQVVRGRVLVNNSGLELILNEGDALPVVDGSLKVLCLTPDLELKVPARIK